MESNVANIALFKKPEVPKKTSATRRKVTKIRDLDDRIKFIFSARNVFQSQKQQHQFVYYHEAEVVQLLAPSWEESDEDLSTPTGQEKR